MRDRKEWRGRVTSSIPTSVVIYVFDDHPFDVGDVVHVVRESKAVSSPRREGHAEADTVARLSDHDLSVLLSFMADLREDAGTADPLVREAARRLRAGRLEDARGTDATVEADLAQVFESAKHGFMTIVGGEGEPHEIAEELVEHLWHRVRVHTPYETPGGEERGDK